MPWTHKSPRGAAPAAGPAVGLVIGLVIGLAPAVGGCSPGSGTGGPPVRDGEPEPGASRSGPPQALVTWAGDMCRVATALESWQAESAEEIAEIKNPPEDSVLDPDFQVQNYLSDAPGKVEQLIRRLDEMKPSGLAAADRLHKAWERELGRVDPEISALGDFSVIHSLGEKEQLRRAERIAGLVASVRAPEPDLKALAGKDPGLGEAHRRAPGCAAGNGSESPAPELTAALPAAADGEDYGACRDGNCEVLVGGQEIITVGDLELHIAVEDGEVTLQHSSPSGGKGQIVLIGPRGTGTFGRPDGQEVTIGTTSNHKGAVLDISTK
ncbi:hypothetical protein [Streptomyces lycii]|uniref:DUF4115 domain-containing protein n=1 Tax=Streptomyces lycii TaxID=2654337 RepID=A0ABQ7FIM1_9ACTN|nr:hypothetical protein [Streptomyces lycii]KAF4407464.1 hypothetical protein GCU69_19380 [Streptomyces lycii]